MRWAFLSAAMAVSFTAGGAAAFVGQGERITPVSSDLTQPAVLHQAASSPEAAAPLCAPVNFNVYFEQSEAKLTGAAERTLDVVGQQIRGCDVAAISIAAATNTISTDEGRELQGARGAAVLAALEARGITAEQVLVQAVGSPNEPASATPEHITVGLEARDAAMAAKRKTHPLESDA
jgi:outer membrane protein OmpA-like peptidoglycan-associated protein